MVRHNKDEITKHPRPLSWLQSRSGDHNDPDNGNCFNIQVMGLGAAIC